MKGKVRGGDVYTSKADDGIGNGDWQVVSPTEFIEAGLLEKVNREVLWPLGLALTITTARKGEELNYDWATMRVHKIEPFEPIVGTQLGEERRAAFEAWRKQRTGEQ